MVKFDQCGPFFSIVFPVVHTLRPSVLQHLDFNGLKCRSSHPVPRKRSQLQIWLIIGSILLPIKCFFMLGNKKSQMAPNQENMEGDQPVQSHSHAQQPLQPHTCVQEHCSGETGLPSSVFQAISEMSLVLLFKVLNCLSSVSLPERKQCS